jgi:Fe-S-cluster containining protein
MNSEEEKRIAEFLGLHVDEMLAEYCVLKPGRTEMKVVDGHCIFYGDDGLCRIHAVKPFDCRRWPLHPGILGDRNAWEAIRKDCPGFSEDASWEDVCRLVRETM